MERVAPSFPTHSKLRIPSCSWTCCMVRKGEKALTCLAVSCILQAHFCRKRGRWLFLTCHGKVCVRDRACEPFLISNLSHSCFRTDRSITLCVLFSSTGALVDLEWEFVPSHLLCTKAVAGSQQWCSGPPKAALKTSGVVWILLHCSHIASEFK